MQALTREELTKFLTACRAQSEQTWLMALMAVNHGFRVSELCGRWAVRRVKAAKGKKVKKIRYFHKGILAREVRDGYISIRALKGSENAHEPLVSNPTPLFDERTALEKLVLITAPNEPLFKLERTTVWRHFQRAGRAAGIALSSAHVRAMKHTLGTLTAEKVPVKVLQKRMRHKNPKSTMAYYDVSDERVASLIETALAL